MHIESRLFNYWVLFVIVRMWSGVMSLLVLLLTIICKISAKLSSLTAIPISYCIIRFHLQDWDQVSAYSGRSIPRPRMYPIESQSIADDMRSHVSHFSGVVGKVGKARYSSELSHRRNEINLINFVTFTGRLLTVNRNTVSRIIRIVAI